MNYKTNIKSKEEAIFNISQAIRLDILETEELVNNLIHETGVKFEVADWLDLASWCVEHIKKELTYRLFRAHIGCTELRKEIYNG